MRVLVIIPAFNEAKKIGQIIESIKDAGFSVLVVDDGSVDDTRRQALFAGAKVLRHVINRGQGAALNTGIAYAIKQQHEVAVFFDADGQMQPSEISKVLNPILSDGVDVVLGSRFLGQAVNLPMSKKILLKVALVFTRLITGLKLTDVHNGFQAWKISALKKINLTQDRQAYASEVLNEIADKKLKYQEVPVTIIYNEYGQSLFNSFSILWDLLIKK